MSMKTPKNIINRLKLKLAVVEVIVQNLEENVKLFWPILPDQTEVFSEYLLQWKNHELFAVIKDSIVLKYLMINGLMLFAALLGF